MVKVPRSRLQLKTQGQDSSSRPKIKAQTQGLITMLKLETEDSKLKAQSGDSGPSLKTKRSMLSAQDAKVKAQASRLMLKVKDQVSSS